MKQNIQKVLQKHYSGEYTSTKLDEKLFRLLKHELAKIYYIDANSRDYI